MAVVYEKTKGLTDAELHYCPGCHHGIIHKLIAETLVELDLLDGAIGVCPVGCSVLAFKYFNCDMLEAAHGRAPAVATGIKRTHPAQAVFTYQGDGDLASIGAAEIVHAAMRGEKFTTIFVNNAIYGMTGGQMAPTTLLGQKTATTPYGRRADLNGFPIKISDILAGLDGTCYVTRQAVHTPAAVRKTKAALKKAIQNALDKKGTSVVEVVSTCNSGWKLSPAKSNQWMEENMFAKYPLGDLKNV